MSRNRRRREEYTQSTHWEPEYRSSSEHGRRPPAELFPRRGFNYWRDDTVAPTSYYPQRSYRRESYNERWHDDSRSWRAESSYSRGRRDFGSGRDWDDREPWRDGSLPHRNLNSETRHLTRTPPYFPRPATRAASPIESILQSEKPTTPASPQKMSPLPKVSSQPLPPSPRYLSLSQEPSEVLHDPTRIRKLLVLDLNGTLLIRSARSRVTSGPHLRPVQPRPYMQSFRQYLFCLETKAWLDTMVWSSAQPHSVDDMVEKVFGATKGELKAVWNRKSLGLSEAEYHRKTVTTKDLTKAWDLFPSALGPEKLLGRSSLQPQTIHSALTTLLLDDSPHKAVLQPYSHVCIPEYDSTRRQRDLRSFLAAKEPKQNKKAKQKIQDEVVAQSFNQIAPERHPIGTLTLTENLYDETLLAVIGILETVKVQSNVAGWIRRGGLLAMEERGEENGTLDVGRRGVTKTECGKTSNKVARTGNDASSTSDPTVASEQAQANTKMWFDDPSVVAFWVAQGRRALLELGIQVIHGVTG